MTLFTRDKPALILGSHNVVEQFPMFGKGATVRWWAERGRVCYEDGRNEGGYSTMDWRQAVEHLDGINKMIAPSSDDLTYADERVRMQRFVEQMMEVIQQARDQGGVWDKGAGAEHKRRRPKSLLVNRPLDNTISGNRLLDNPMRGL